MTRRGPVVEVAVVKVGVDADGTVRPCFFHAALGNVHENTLEQILNAPNAVEFRRTLDVKENPICKTCVCTLSMGRRTPA